MYLLLAIPGLDTVTALLWPPALPWKAHLADMVEGITFMRLTSREGGTRERIGSSEGCQKLMVVRKLGHVPDSLRPQTQGS